MPKISGQSKLEGGVCARAQAGEVVYDVLSGGNIHRCEARLCF